MNKPTDFPHILTELHVKLGSDQAILDELRRAAPYLALKDSYLPTLWKLRASGGTVKQPRYDIGREIVELHRRLCAQD